ncbi:hypothetical protein Ahy_B03g065378 [Arachis hypogaea]|uniref:Replication protein A 70 kDa DNA-binding subunit B/D first OB fold domain-containing protein n=1 Tax=Arachis hypogaea TaxID=3818 RepID=A0A445A1G1_ARAHY|nr:hypothetical protein Ahy_B03g065378 [Arachis hypogaea]
MVVVVAVIARGGGYRGGGGGDDGACYSCGGRYNGGGGGGSCNNCGYFGLLQGTAQQALAEKLQPGGFEGKEETRNGAVEWGSGGGGNGLIGLGLGSRQRSITELLQSLYWCFGSTHKSNKRVGHAVLVPEPVAPAGLAATAAPNPSTTIVMPFIIPLSSPESFLQSDPPSATHSPAGLLSLTVNSYSSGGPASICEIWLIWNLFRSSWILHISCNKRRLSSIDALLSSVLHPVFFNDEIMHQIGNAPGPLKWFVQNLLEEGTKSPRTIRLAALHLTVAFDADFEAELADNNDARLEVSLLARSPDQELIEHHKVQATVEDNFITTFIHQLKEEDVFIISDFKVIPNGGLVRVTRHRFCILFKCSTSVVAAASRVIRNPGLSLTSMDEILQKRTDYEYLIDFVGVLCGLKRKTDVECNGKILKVIILEGFADGKKIPCNLVGDCSALIDINSLKRYQRPPVFILQSFKIKVNGDKVSLQNVINISRLIRTIANLKGNNEDGQFFVVGKIKEIVEDPEWWVFSCVCGHPIIGDDNVFHCQLCSREVQHFMIRIKILVEDRISCGMFVLLDSAATKLLGRMCSDVFLLLEDEMDFFHQLIGKEIVFKVQAKRINTPGYCGTFKVINVISDARFFNKLQVDQFIKDVSSDSAFSPIFEDFSQYGQLGNDDNQVISGVPIQVHTIKEMLADILCAKIYASTLKNDQICFLIGEIIDVLKHQKWWYYCCLCNAAVCHVGNVFYCYLCRVECIDAIRRYRIKIIVFHSNGSNIFILQDDEVMQILKKSCSDFLIDERNSPQSTDDYTILNSIISQLMNKKIVFIVDTRPVGYKLNTSLHIVRAICDDIDIVKFLEDSTHDNQQQTVNHDFHARISSPQGSNLFGNHQSLTIREELRSAFGQCENTIEAVERMDECSG